MKGHCLERWVGAPFDWWKTSMRKQKQLKQFVVQQMLHRRQMIQRHMFHLWTNKPYLGYGDDADRVKETTEKKIALA